MFSLNGPTISTAARAKLEKQSKQLLAYVKGVEGHYRKIAGKRRELEQARIDAERENHAAAQGNKRADLEYLAAQRRIIRLTEEIAELEAQVHEKKQPLFRAIDDAQEAVRLAVQITHSELLDAIASALSPFSDSYPNCLALAQNLPVMGVFRRDVMSHHCTSASSLEILVAEAKDVARKVEAVLSGGIIFEYQGTTPPVVEPSAKAA
jgi:hypothetical protein